jgi:glutamate dehydrogenase (NAD(P)+)
MKTMHSVQQKTSTRDEFYEQLNVLKERFAAMPPELEVTLRDPALGVEGYVVVWNTGISVGGPLERCGKGGTRITTNVSLDEVKMLARTMSLKNAAAGLPMGGSKAALKADPSAPDFEQKYRRFAQLCKPFLRENGGVFGGFGFDIGARPEHALWICDELKSTNSFTGKPKEMGGTDYDREGIAGLGVAVAAITSQEIKGADLNKTSFAVQGMGAMGAAVLRYFAESGATMTYMADPKYGGTWKFASPISTELHTALIRQDSETALKLLPQEGALLSDSADDVLFQKVDVLFPCAVQNVITESKADRVKAMTVVEGANGPVTEEARTALFAMGVTVIPDFIANPGGIIAAFVELTSTSDEKAQEAKSLARERIAVNVRDMLEMAAHYNVEPSHAGHFMALSRIIQTQE